MSLPFPDAVTPYLIVACRFISTQSLKLSENLSRAADIMADLPPCATSSVSLLFLAIFLVLILPSIIDRIVRLSIKSYYSPPSLPTRAIKGKCLAVLRAILPNVRRKVEKEILSATRAFEKSLVRDPASPIAKLPETGLGPSEAALELKKRADAEEGGWSSGTLSGAIYMKPGLEEVFRVAGECYARANLLHTENFNSSRQMEAEVVAWVAELFQGSAPIPVGSITSGGTESLLLAVKSYRDRARTLKGVTRPNLVVSETAHAAFWKAGDYFGVEIRVAPCVKKCQCRAQGRSCLGWMLEQKEAATSSPTSSRSPCKKGEVILPFLRALINENTIAVVGSAPNYPYGTIDPLAELGALAIETGIGFHVDACLGGLLLPFSKADGQSGVSFGIPGVTSISCDTHKYGCAPKGTSVLLWSNEDYRKYQFSFKTDWSGGVYATPTICGSRAAASTVACWGVMRAIGAEGYRKQAQEIFEITRSVAEEISKDIPELEQLGRADVCVVAFAVHPNHQSVFDIFEISEHMKKIRNWHLNLLQGPAGCHIAVTPANAEMVKKFLVLDLKRACLEAKGKGQSDAAAFYGATASAPIQVVEEIAEAYLNVCYTVNRGQLSCPTD